MTFLIYSISFSVAVSVFLKLARRWRLDIAQAIAANYLAATGLCLIAMRPTADALLHRPPSAWVVLILLGVLLPSVFLVMAAAVRHAGIVLSDTAQRLSLVIPLLAAFFLFREPFAPVKLAGIAMALCALGCLLARRSAPGETYRAADKSSAAPPAQTADRYAIPTLLGVWAGYGTIDILFKQMARSGAEFTSSLLLSFILAALVMGLWLASRGTRWNLRSIGAGLGLGVLNFSNIYFYIRAHQAYPHNPTLVFAAMNIGVITVGAIVGAGLFGERLNRINGLGIALAVGSIALLLPA